MQSPKFKELSQHFKMLPGHISKISSTEEFSVDKFKEEWRTVLGSPESQEGKEIVYIWVTDKLIPRLKGESNIIYIGKTINTIHNRHYQYADIEANGKRNNPRYKHIPETFGQISFHVASYKQFGCDDVKAAEKKLLQAYFDDHLEYPPLNRMGK